MPIGLDVLQKKNNIQRFKLHHKALKVVNISNKNYDERLRDDNEVSIYQSHLCAIICEVFNSLNKLNPEFMWSYFAFKSITYNIRRGPLLRLPAAKSTSSEHVYFETVCPNLLNTMNLLLNWKWNWNSKWKI